MVTIAVLAILMAMAAPAFNDFFQRYRLRGAADDVANLIASARADAVARNRDVAIVFVGSGAAWCVGAAAAEPTAPGDAVPAAPTCTCANTCEIDQQVRETQGANYRGVTMAAAPASFVFDRLNGSVQPLNAATMATLQSPNGVYSLAVNVSPLGRGRLCVPVDGRAMAGFKSC